MGGVINLTQQGNVMTVLRIYTMMFYFLGFFKWESTLHYTTLQIFDKAGFWLFRSSCNLSPVSHFTQWTAMPTEPRLSEELSCSSQIPELLLAGASSGVSQHCSQCLWTLRPAQVAHWDAGSGYTLFSTSLPVIRSLSTYLYLFFSICFYLSSSPLSFSLRHFLPNSAGWNVDIDIRKNIYT